MPDKRPSRNNHDRIECNQEYSKKLISSLDQLRQEKSLCDVSITVDSTTFKAHKLVLSASSSYFKAMFTSGFQECSTSQVVIDGKSHIFAKLLDFAYTGNLSVSLDTLADIIDMACYMQFNDVLYSCMEYLQSGCHHDLSLSVDEICLVLAQANERYQLPLLRKFHDDFIVNKFAQLCVGKVFQQDMTAKNLGQILDQKDLGKCTSEDMILKGLLHWLEFDWESRKVHTPTLLKKIRLGLVTPKRLQEVLKNDILMAQPGCKTLIHNILRCQTTAGEDGNMPMSERYKEFFLPRGLTKTMIGISALQNKVMYYETDEKKWNTLQGFPAPPVSNTLENFQMIVANGHLFFTGGAEPDDDFRGEVECFQYNNKWNKWVKIQSLLTGRFNHSLVYLDGYIYAIGGSGVFSELDQVERYGIDCGLRQSWLSLAPLPHPVLNPSAVAFNGSILVYHKLDNCRGMLYKFDPHDEEEEWEIIFNEYIQPCFRVELVIHGRGCYRVLLMDQNPSKVNRLIFDENWATSIGAEEIQDPNIHTHLPCAVSIEREVYEMWKGNLQKTGISLNDGSSERNIDALMELAQRRKASRSVTDDEDDSTGFVNYTFDLYSVK